MLTRIIGDIHGDMEAYHALLPGADRTIQVGDFGVGFGADSMMDPRHIFIRGNHDNPALCREHPNWVADGTVDEGMMFVGGAVSADRNRRIEGVDWWADEELSIEELNRMVDIYDAAKPSIMITHECPSSISSYLNYPGKTEPTRTVG